MDEKELIRAVNNADEQTLKKIKAVVDFRTQNKGLSGGSSGRGMTTEERLFYSAVVHALARHRAGFAEYEDAEQGTRLPGFDISELRAAKQAVDQVYEQSFSDSTLSLAKFYHLMASCAYRSIENQQKRRSALKLARRVLHHGGDAASPDKDKALRFLIDTFSTETITVNRSVKGMFDVLKQADEVLDESFPGYARSGLLRMILHRVESASAT